MAESMPGAAPRNGQIALTPEQQTQLLAELQDSGPADEALRAVVAGGVVPVTPELLALLAELAVAVPGDWAVLHREACTVALFGST